MQSVEQKHYGELSEDEVEDLQNDITMLRNDLKMNIFMQQRINFDQLPDESATEDLELAVKKLLEKFEDAVDNRVEQLQVGLEFTASQCLRLIGFLRCTD